MFVLMFWMLIIECMTVEIKVVYGNDRVIITIPVHIKKLHHTKTIYKIVEKPVHGGLRSGHEPQTTAPGQPDRGRQHGWYGGGGGGETVKGADADSHEARRPQSSPHEDRGSAATTTGYRDRGHGASRAHEPGPFDSAPRSLRQHKHADRHRGGVTLVHVVGGHKHGHYGDVMYVGDHEPRHLAKHVHRPAHRPEHTGDAAGDPNPRGPPHVAPYMVPGPAPAPAPGHLAPLGLPVVVVPPPHHRGHDGHHGHGGYQVQENVVDFDGRPDQTAADPLPYIAVGPAPAVSSPQQHTAFASPQTAVSHVYYTLDPVVPYDDVMRPSL